MKCIVRLCPNKEEDGTFHGPLCTPCAVVLRGRESANNPAAKRILATLILEGTEVT